MYARGKEREVKLIVPDDFQLTSLPLESVGLTGMVEQPALDLSAEYYDTPDLQLLSYGITLRRRTGEHVSPLWTAKLPADEDNTVRSEISVASNNEHPPGEIEALIRTVLVGDEVLALARLNTRRLPWLLYEGGEDPIAELTDDCVTVFDDGGEQRFAFREIEVEARDDRARLGRIARLIRHAGGRQEQVAKVSRALAALGFDTARPPDPVVLPGDPVGEAIRAAITHQTRAMVAQAPYAFLGDIEGVHRMRVRQRHLRSVIRSLGPIVDRPRFAPLMEDLRQLGVFLGDVRDLDVFRAWIAAASDPDDNIAPLLDRVDARLTSSRDRLQRALISERYMSLVRMSRALASDDCATRSTRTCEDELPRLAARAAQRVRKAADTLSVDAPETDFHEARKLAKRARYVASTFADFLDSKRASSLRRFASRMASVQNVLGEFHDATIARDLLLTIANEDFRSDGSMSVLIGRLAERADQTSSDLRHACLKAWERLEKELGDSWPRA